MIDSLQEIITDKKLTRTDKNTLHSYIDQYYEEAFGPYRDKSINILEIGTREGDSLRLWDVAFPKAEIWGIDNNIEPHLTEWVKGDRIHHVYGNAYDPILLETLPIFDIVIDDGPHTEESQLDCVKLYLKKLNEGGFIVIEDIQDFSTVEKLKQEYVKCGGTKPVDVYDLRKIKDRYDDVIVVLYK